MSERPYALGIIPARGGSKGLPRKNVAPLAGRPVIAYTIGAALECAEIDRVVVTTEDEEIRSVAVGAGAEVVRRPDPLAGDDVLTSAVVRHVLETLGGLPDTAVEIVLLQPTSPLRTSEHITRCLRGFRASGAASAVSLTVAEHHPYKMFTRHDGTLTPLFGEEDVELPRQRLPEVLRPNGAIFVTRREVFLRTARLTAPPVFGFEMDPLDSVDIDTRADLVLAETLLTAR